MVKLEGWEQDTDSVLFAHRRQFSLSEWTSRCPNKAEYGIVTSQKVAPKLLSPWLSTDPLESAAETLVGSEVVLMQVVLWREDWGEGVGC